MPYPNRLVNFMMALLLAVGFTHCGQGTVNDSKTVAEDHNEAKFNADAAIDAAFLTDAAELNLQEIALGALAEKNGMMPEIQALGKQMKHDHESALAKLRTLATKKSISIPDLLTEKGKQSYKNLMAQPGKDFDRAYAGLMAEQHKTAIDKFERAVNQSKDLDIVAWATWCLPILRIQLDRAMDCQLKSDKRKE